MTASAPSTLTPLEISADLKVSVRTVQDLLKDGAIPAKRVGQKHWRCRREDYETWKATPDNDPRSEPPTPRTFQRSERKPAGKPSAKRPLRRLDDEL